MKSYLENDINNVQDLKVFLDIIRDQKLPTEESEDERVETIEILEKAQKPKVSLAQKKKKA